MKELLNPEFLTLSKSDCTGCNACFNACPAEAISMDEDNEGFWYPHIDSKECTSCGACAQACPSLNLNLQLPTEAPEVYAAWTKDEDLRISSTSGGVFSALASVTLQGGGYVFGARYRDDFSIEHYGINSLEELEQLKQSKYAQSDICLIYREIESLLDKNKTVMFCGTPCQSAGLQNYLGQPRETLIICDFICRGVNSPMVYKMYLESLTQEYNAPIQSVQFKNKDVGWNQFLTKVLFENGHIYSKNREADGFMRGYLSYNLYLRPSCYKCRYKSIPRIADITLGDFWGIKWQLDSNRGTSAVLLNTKKGMRILQNAHALLKLCPTSLSDALKSNLCLSSSPCDFGNRKDFFKALAETNSFAKAMLLYPAEHKQRSLISMADAAKRFIRHKYCQYFLD